MFPWWQLTVASSSRNEKTSEAIRNPTTNLGNRSQMTRALGRTPVSASFLKVHQIDIRESGDADENILGEFHDDTRFHGAALMRAPAATTEPLVSSVPPSQAPATTSDISKAFAIDGISTIMGTATIRTSEVT